MEWKIGKIAKAIRAFEKEMTTESSDVYTVRSYSLREARDYLLEVSAKYPKVEQGMICVYDASAEAENGQRQRYTVKVFALDRQAEAVEISTGRYLGKILQAKEIDAELAEIIEEENKRIIQITKEN